MAIEGIDVPMLLAELDRRGRNDATAFCAARVIRNLEIQLASVEEELLESEFSRYAHAAEIHRMNDHRRSWETRRAQKAARS